MIKLKDLAKRILYNIVVFVDCFGMLMLNYYFYLISIQPFKIPVICYKEGITCFIDDFTFMALPILIMLDIVVISIFISLIFLIWSGFDE